MFRQLEVFDGVSAAGTGFEVELVGVCLVFVAEGNGCFNVPRREFGSMRHMACIVHGKPLLQVLRGSLLFLAFRCASCKKNRLGKPKGLPSLRSFSERTEAGAKIEGTAKSSEVPNFRDFSNF